MNDKINPLLRLRGRITQTDIILMIEMYRSPMSPREMCDFLDISQGDQGVFVLRMKRSGMIYAENAYPSKRKVKYKLTTDGERVVEWIRDRIKKSPPG